MTIETKQDDSVRIEVRQGSVTFTVPIRVRIELGQVVVEQSGPSVARYGPANETMGSGATSLGAAVEAAAAVDEAQQAYARVASAKWVGLDSSEFNWQNALAMAACSNLAYSEPATVRNVCQNQWSLGETQFVAAGQTQCFVTAHAKALIVAFRGTKEFMDWFTNLNTLERRTSFGSVHDGFYRAFLAVSSQLESHIERFGRGLPLVLTGHSLGGALATLAAAYWRGKYKLAGLYTYGQPCVGFESFKAFMNIQVGPRYYRFVNADDIVPRVPPRYVHAGRLMRFDSQGNVVARLVTESLQDTSTVELLMSESTDALTDGSSPSDPPALTPTEFEAVQSRLESVRGPVELETTLSQSLNADEASMDLQLESAQLAVSGGLGGLEGLFPDYFSDHRMRGYLSKIMRQILI